ncbi:glycosyltransferase family 2 protein [Virgibacillus salexigens]|uniref:glycosyltransferase family 2 protein n=1 Tax=Virgibacillus salexigens TaxID=61016 RepID=UPI00190DBA2F|nr:glycosyltransferase family 2 protein [Virgibacillus salexigens]
MVTISLCMIVKNEEHVLERCLDSISHLVDEINIVDTGSNDHTVAIAKKYTDRVFHFEWTDNFSEARNQSFSYATKDYIFYLDADDVIDKMEQEKLFHLKKHLNPEFDAVSMIYLAGIDEYENVTLQYRRNRLVKRRKQYQWFGDCHNYLQVRGKIFHSDIAVSHKKNAHAYGRNLHIYEAMICKSRSFTERDYFYYGNELRENGFYQQAIEAYTNGINMKYGWIEEKIFACIFRADCFYYLNEAELALESLFQSFGFSKTARSEACSRIGLLFQKKREFLLAIFWYELALRVVQPKSSWGFSYPAYSTWYPHQQLCICYYNLQAFDLAAHHNNKAMEYRPNDELLRFHQTLLKGK